MQMRSSRLAIAACLATGLAALTLSACVPPSPEPTPAPSPTPTPAPAPPPVTQAPTPSYDNWMDAPATPGTWSYVNEAGESLALFGGTATDPVFMMRCDKASRRVGIARQGQSGGQVAMTIRTETIDRTLTASQIPGRALLAAEVPASDSLLDAMAFSKGRFALETGGMPSLYIPAWPEVTRVVEDCR